MVKKLGIKAAAIGTLIGAGAGYLAGILTAPQSGKDTRKDISNKANKVRRDGEKQLKKMYTDLTALVKEGEARGKKARGKANEQLKESVEKGKKARGKAKEMLSAIHNGEADDPNLQAVIEEVRLAKDNLSKYLKK
jgi:gas vesicle protein